MHQILLYVYCYILYSYISLDFTTRSTRNNYQEGPQSRDQSETVAVPSQTFLVPIYALTGTVAAIVSCILAVAAVAYIWRATLSKRRKIDERDSSSGDNCVYDEIVEPVYEKMECAKNLVTIDDVDVTVMENEAYKCITQTETNFSSIEVDLTINDAYMKGSSLILMENNSSYQTTAPLRAPIAEEPKTLANTQPNCNDKHISCKPETLNSCTVEVTLPIPNSLKDDDTLP